MEEYVHISVQKEKSINYLNIKKNGIYFDCTFGRGGHSLEILKKLDNTGLLISIDKDLDAFLYYKDFFPKYSNHIFVNDSFSNLKDILEKLSISKVDGFIFDFGVSSPMFDNPKRGFSYRFDSRLDMRMDQNQKLDAYWIINNYSVADLTKIFKNYGNVKNAYVISNSIDKARKIKPIVTTFDFLEIIKKSISKKEMYSNKSFANKYFQAIRIEVNNEMDEIEKGIKTALNFLNTKGRIVTISFHSLEEKIIKKAFLSTKNEIFPKEIPINNIKNEYRIINVKNRWANNEEIETNSRAHSSLLKIIERE